MCNRKWTHGYRLCTVIRSSFSLGLTAKFQANATLKQSFVDINNCGFLYRINGRLMFPLWLTALETGRLTIFLELVVEYLVKFFPARRIESFRRMFRARIKVVLHRVRPLNSFNNNQVEFCAE